MKYYVIKTTARGVEYKRYKCVDGWSRIKSRCWIFSRAGAERIADRLNASEGIPGRVHFNILPAPERS